MGFWKYRLYQPATSYRKSSSPFCGNYHWDVAIQAVAKRSDDNPYMVFNELLAMRLGSVVGLPVADGLPIVGIPKSEADKKITDIPHWASLSVGENLPDADCEELAKNLPDLSCGIVVFDSFIANPDRHERNLSFNAAKNEVAIFDHGESLCNRIGVDYLRSQRGRLGFQMHAIAYCLHSLMPMNYWITRIQEISRETILSEVRTAGHISGTAIDINAFSDELIFRQHDLSRIISQSQDDRSIFASLKAGLFRLEASCDTINSHSEAIVRYGNDMY